MILLTKRNHDKFLLNHQQIEHIECIPESKITMMNHDYYLVRESVEEIIHKIAEYNAKVQDIHREIAVSDKRRWNIDKIHRPGAGARPRERGISS